MQVVKDPIGGKGARLTTQLSIPSRYLVLLPQSRVIGVSARIEDEVERARLKSLVGEFAGSGVQGYIVRTNAEGQPAEALAEDIAYLSRAWALVESQVETTKVGACVYEDLNLPMRAVRDLIRRDVEKVKVDSRETCERLQAFAAQFMPGLAEKIEHYSGARPGSTCTRRGRDQARAGKEVPLKSGGYLVIDQTEAMTTVDVNTVRLGQRNLEETGIAPTSRPRRRSRGNCGCATSAASSSSTSSTCTTPSTGARCCARWRNRWRVTTPRPPCTTSRRWAWSR